MDTTLLTAIVGLLIALSIASERLVEIIKSVIPFLNTEKTDPTMEGIRRAILQILAVTAGIFTAFLARPTIPISIIPEKATEVQTILALGLLASGGSGFWNAVLGYLTNVKDIKKIEKKNMS